VSSPNALHSLYGEGHLNATRTRECVAMPGTRDQRICSPPLIIERVLRLWTSGIKYDPCGCEGSIVGAERSTSTRGLIDPWPEFTYFNPPYGASLYDPEKEMELLMLEEAIRAERKAVQKMNKGRPKDKRVPLPKFPAGLPLQKAGLDDWLTMHLYSANLQIPRAEIIGLVPNRTNRRWLRHWRSACDALVELDPLTFLVHNGETWEMAPSAFPAPLVLGYTGPRGALFCAAFADIGDPV
jgi:hypothetical protein